MSVIFSYPASGSITNSVTLRSPQYGNSETYDNNVAFSLTMDATVFSYIKKKKQTLLLTFNGITKALKDDFAIFYLATIGQEILYTDQLADDWTAKIITNPLETITEIGSGACELFSFTLQLRVTPN